MKLLDYAKLEEDLKAQKASADVLESEIEKLKAEAAEKQVLHARLRELEQQLAKLEAQLEEEVLSQKEIKKKNKKKKIPSFFYIN